jgi:myo-inositol-1(or 4)-monophosphatase
MKCGAVAAATALPRDPRLSLGLRLAQEAGRHALASAGRASVAWKRGGERVTDVDVAIQSRMVQEVATWFPGDGALAEEESGAANVEGEFIWVLDPLDGTNNYALGIPCFSISVGILRAGLPYAGVVHDPNTGFTCWALQGQGAFAGDRQLAVQGRPLTAVSNVSVRIPLDPELQPLVSEWLGRHKFRAFGSVALQLGYAALGALDVIVDHKAALWDIAAGAAVLLEAGGLITDPLGRTLFPFDVVAYRGEAVPFVAGNPVAHDEALSACRALLGAGRP